MRLIKTLAATVPLLGLVACAGSTKYVSAPVNLQPAPAKLTVSCDAPTVIPDRELTQEEVERFWGNDRARLVICSKRHKTLMEFYKTRDKALSAS